MLSTWSFAHPTMHSLLTMRRELRRAGPLPFVVRAEVQTPRRRRQGETQALRPTMPDAAGASSGPRSPPVDRGCASSGRPSPSTQLDHHRLAAVSESVKPRMLQESAQNASHPDVLGQAGHPGADTADAAHDQIDLCASGTGRRTAPRRSRHPRRVDLDRDVTVCAERGLVPMSSSNRFRRAVGSNDQRACSLALCYSQ